jgi:hypothetical protein
MKLKMMMANLKLDYSRMIINSFKLSQNIWFISTKLDSFIFHPLSMHLNPPHKNIQKTLINKTTTNDYGFVGQITYQNVRTKMV